MEHTENPIGTAGPTPPNPDDRSPALSGHTPVATTNCVRRSGTAWYDAAPSWLSLFDPRQPEAFLAFCSAWCALQMWIWPNQFAAINATVSISVGLRGHEQVWAIFAGFASLLKLLGLACRMSRRWAGFASGLRASGLFMSIVFWLIVGLSRVLDFPHLITPVALTGLGVAAAFELASHHEPRETWS